MRGLFDTPREAYQISAKHFVAGLTVMNEAVCESAPIISYMMKWKLDRVKSYCEYKGWTISYCGIVED